MEAKNNSNARTQRTNLDQTGEGSLIPWSRDQLDTNLVYPVKTKYIVIENYFF